MLTKLHSQKFAGVALGLAVACAGCSMAGTVPDDGSEDSTSGTTGDDMPTTGTTPGSASGASGASGASASATGVTGDPDNCGNGQLDGGEACDGDEFGGQTCVDINPAFTGGTLACASDCASVDASGCMVDPASALVTLNEIASQGVHAGEYADMGDAIELYNAGAVSADLSGWRLSDEPDFPEDKTYVFPAGTTLAPGAFMVLLQYDADTMTGQFPFGISASNDETLTLLDTADFVRDVITFNGSDATTSLCRLPDGTGAWQACDQSFGAPNIPASATCGDGQQDGDEACDGDDLGGQTCADLGYRGGVLGCTANCTYDASLCNSDSTVVVNEVESSGDDRIELYNAGAVAVDLSGWILTDTPVDGNYDPDTDDGKLVFAPGTIIAPKAFLVSPKGEEPGQHPFGLGAGGDLVYLVKPDLAIVDQLEYGDGEAAQSYCRVPDGPGGAWTPGCTPTFGAPNQGP